MPASLSDRRDQLIRCAEAVSALATERSIVAQHVSKLKCDHEIRKVLDAVVRRWSELAPATHYTDASTAGAAAKRQKDHLVPRRVLIDRMIMNPADCQSVLETAVVLVEVSGEEHRRLGHIYATHADLYAEMLTAPVDELVALGMVRYERGGVEIKPYIF